MGKEQEISKDANVDIIDVSKSVTRDFGGELAKNEGFDLNKESETINASKTLEKNIGQRIGAGLLIPFAISGGDAREAPNALVHEVLSSPEWNTHIGTTYELPSYDSALAQSVRDFDPSGEAPRFSFDGKVYDDGKFDPDAQIKASEIANALNQPVAADITDPPFEYFTDGFDLNEEPIEVETPEVFEPPDFAQKSNNDD